MQAAETQAPSAFASVSAAQPQLDLSKVKIEPLFEDFVDFDTFSKSDFRVVKIEACEAVPKSKKLLKFTLNDGTERRRTILQKGKHLMSNETLLNGEFKNVEYKLATR